MGSKTPASTFELADRLQSNRARSQHRSSRIEFFLWMRVHALILYCTDRSTGLQKLFPAPARYDMAGQDPLLAGPTACFLTLTASASKCECKSESGVVPSLYGLTGKLSRAVSSYLELALYALDPTLRRTQRTYHISPIRDLVQMRAREWLRRFLARCSSGASRRTAKSTCLTTTGLLGYDSAVRRIPAILLLGLFSFSLIEPALVAGDDSKLPACCRRDGQHHCAMTGESSAGGAVVQALCAAFPKTGATPAYAKLAGIRPEQWIFGQSVGHPAGYVQTQALFHVSFSRARQKRGPPALLS